MTCRRGTSNSNCRGSSYDRRARKQWLLDDFGDGETVQCWQCMGWLTWDTLTVDRIVPGADGGRYTRDNIMPACMPCNIARGDNYLSGHPDWEHVPPIAEGWPAPEPVGVPL